MQAVSAQKASLRVTGLIGATVFAMFFALTYSVPGWVEGLAAKFIESEVAAEIDSRVDNFRVTAGDSALSQLAAALYQQNEHEIDRLKTALKADIHSRMASALAQIRDLDCKCRDAYAQRAGQGFRFDIALSQAANDKIVAFIQATYMRIVGELRRDIRLFTGINSGAFLLLLLVSFFKPRATGQLFVPGALLAVAAVVCAYFYVFEQNGLLTIIYAKYLGFAYLAYLGVVFLALCDIVLNRARVTTRVANVFLHVAGSAVRLAPC